MTPDTTTFRSPQALRRAWPLLTCGLALAFQSSLAMGMQSRAAVAALDTTVRDANHWHPTWSPDGREIAWSAIDAAGDYELYVITLATGAVRQLTDNGSDDMRPRWSPNGARIAFVSDRDGNRELYAIDVRSLAETRLTRTARDEDRMWWSPDGRSLVHDAGGTGEWDLWILDVASGTLERLTSDAGFEGYPAWSPDGKRIAFNSNRHNPAGGADAREIWVVELASGAMTRLTDNGANDQSPAWSPDGRRLAYFSARDSGNFEIYVMDADGSNQVRATNDPEWDFMPVWSPDGSRIAFDSRRDGRRAIYTMNPDGSDIRKLTNLRMSPFIELARRAGADSAIAAYHAAIDAGGAPDMYFLEVELLALAREGRVEPLASLRLLETNVEAHPRSVIGWTTLGDAFRSQDLPLAARSAYFTALGIDPAHAPAIAGLGATKRE